MLFEILVDECDFDEMPLYVFIGIVHHSERTAAEQMANTHCALNHLPM